MPGYVIAQINMTNKEGFKVYAEQVPKTIKQFGGKYVVRAGEYTSMEGKWDYTRNVIIEFPIGFLVAIDKFIIAFVIALEIKLKLAV